MRSVRCDQCGMRAMLAASQCPHCGHLFELRDGFGESLPLAHCAACDSYYPARQGSCRWCGTQPESFRVAPYAWKGVGVLACVGLGWAAWLANRTTSEQEAAIVNLPVEKPTVTLTTQVDSGSNFIAPILGEVFDSANHYPGTTGVTSDSVVSDPASLGPAPAPYAIDTIPREPPPAVTVRPAAATKPVARPRTVRWVRATARRWVTVRASATSKSRIVASIGPDTRVQLGESRGEWRRIRTKGITGWIEGSRF
jgi:SH3-like domain-containing protein